MQPASATRQFLAFAALFVTAHFGGEAQADTRAEPASWRDTPVSRLEALALLQTLNTELLSGSSATLTLERWCREHALADPAVIVARRIPAAESEPAAVASAAQREALQVSADEPIRYRRVELACGAHVLSVAGNWYVPSRLTDAMNRLLETTQIPFGKVVLPLHPHRETLEVKALWFPLPENWAQPGAPRERATRAHARLEIPAALFEHRVLLYNDTHLPVAELDEVYQRGVIDFAEPRLP